MDKNVVLLNEITMAIVCRDLNPIFEFPEGVQHPLLI